MMHGLLTAFGLLCLIINTRETAACITAERDALAAFNASIINPDGRLRSWHGENCCNWSGVSCSKKTGHVYKLDLGEYTLKGEINPSLVGLTRLVYLSLSQSDFGGVPIPEVIFSFKMLRYLDLSHAGFGGTVPPQLGNLSRLSYLNLSSTSSGSHVITVDNFHWVSKLTSLRYLDLSWLYLAASVDWLQAVNMLPLLEVLRLNDASLPATNLNSLSQVNFTALKLLNLSKNSLSGVVPASIGNLSSLTYLDMSFNTFHGTLSELHFANLSRLDTLDLASNYLEIVFKQSWVPPFQLTKLGLHACLVGPEFPAWLQSQIRIEIIDLGNAGIRGALPDWTWNFSSSITSLNVSTNNIIGKLPASLEQSKMLTTLNMRFNRLEGSIPDLPTTVGVLDLSENYLPGSLPSFGANGFYYLSLSHNFISGVIPADLCSMISMEVVDLSNNKLSGELPNCWHKNSRLYVIDFSSNNFWGEIPSTMGSLNSLMSLHLSKNSLSGMLPTSLQSCNMLMFLDLAENKLSGNIPKWIDGLRSLILLSLGSNQFYGEIPEELSQLPALQNLDLCKNKLSGPVPSFLGNLTALHLGNPDWSTSPFLRFMVYGVGRAYFSVYTDSLQVTFKGQILHFVGMYKFKGIDLSANQLTGEIPSEIGFLSALHGLNLSRNHIGGSIPDVLGGLVNLEELDLSWNDLSGPIPHSLTSMDYLGFLNLSYNDLSGKIPFRGQIVTFVEDSFLGNMDLCGPPLSTRCLPKSNKHHHRFDMLTYLFTLLGFAFGISIVFTTIICSTAARKAYFQFTDRILNKLCTAVEMKLNINRMSAGRDPSLAIRSQDSITISRSKHHPAPRGTSSCPTHDQVPSAVIQGSQENVCAA